MTEPVNLKTGYYRVRKGTHWRVSRWMPQDGVWRDTIEVEWPVGHYDEIGEKVA